MVFLLAYAFVVWYIAFRYRRRWPAFVAVFASLQPVGILTFATVNHLAVRLDGEEAVIYGFAGAYAALLLSLGLFIAIQPRHVPEHACRACDYDLHGNTSGLCPECGLALDDPRRFVRLRAVASTAPAHPPEPPPSSLGVRLATSEEFRERVRESTSASAETMIAPATAEPMATAQ